MAKKSKNSKNLQRGLVLVVLLGLVAVFVQLGGGGLFSVLTPATGLVSGETFDVIDSFNGVQDTFIQGTFQTSSNEPQSFEITGESIPDTFSASGQASIGVGSLQSTDELEIVNQQDIHRLDYIRFNSGIRYSTTAQCLEDFQEQKDLRYPDLTVFEDIPVSAYSYYAYPGYRCGYHFIADLGKIGTIGQLNYSSTSAQQIIELNGVDEWVLTGENNFTATTSNGQINNEDAIQYIQPIRSENIWFRDNNTNNPNTWEKANIRTRAERWVEYYNRGVDQGARVMGNLHSTMNLDASVMLSNNEDPSDWVGEYTDIRNVGSAVFVDRNITQGSEYNLVLDTDQLSLQRQGLECDIIQSPSSVSFSEATQGSVQYEVQNTGLSDGRVVVRSTCSGLSVNSEQDEFLLASNQRMSGELLLSTQVDGSSPINGVCELACQPAQFSSGNVGSSSDYSLTVTPLTSCEAGDTSEPLLIGGELVVYEYDANCGVADRTTCSVEEGFSQNLAGDYVCGGAFDTSGLRNFFNNLGIAFALGVAIILVLLAGLVVLSLQLIRRGK